MKTEDTLPHTYTKNEVVHCYIHYYSTTPLLLNFLFKSLIEERARLVGKIQKYI